MTRVRLGALLLALSLCSSVSGEVYMDEKAELPESTFQRFLGLSSKFIKGGEKDGAELAHEQLPAGSTKLMQAMHAFEKAAHAVSLRHANLEHAAQLKQVGGAGAEAAQSKAKMQELPMQKLRWGHKYLENEYGGNWYINGGFNGDGCDHMFKSLCNGETRRPHGYTHAWWNGHGWSSEGSDLIHAAHFDRKNEDTFHEAVEEIHNKEMRRREERADWLLNRTEHLIMDKYDFDLKRRKKAYLQKQEDKNTVDDYAKSSVLINGGLLNKMQEDSTYAFGAYGAAEAQAAEEEIEEMANWHELIESMKRSGKADPLYIKQVEAQGASMMATIRSTMLRLHDQVQKKEVMEEKDKAEVKDFQQQQLDREKRAEARQEAYTAKNEEEERAAEEASERMLSKQGNTFSGIGQSRHVQQEKSASAQEAERQKELELARKQNAAVEEGGLDALHKARKEAAAHDLKLKLREEKETSQERAAEHKAADKLLAATNLDAHKAATNAVDVSKAARQLAHNVLVHKQMNTLHAQAQARVAKSQMSQHNLRPVHESYTDKYLKNEQQKALKFFSKKHASAKHVVAVGMADEHERKAAAVAESEASKIIGIPPMFANKLSPPRPATPQIKPTIHQPAAPAAAVAQRAFKLGKLHKEAVAKRQVMQVSLPAPKKAYATPVAQAISQAVPAVPAVTPSAPTAKAGPAAVAISQAHASKEPVTVGIPPMFAKKPSAQGHVHPLAPAGAAASGAAVPHPAATHPVVAAPTQIAAVRPVQAQVQKDGGAAQDKVEEMRELYPNMSEEEARKVVAQRELADKQRSHQAAAAVAVRQAQTAPNVKISTAKKPVYAAYEAPEKTQALHLKEVLNAAPKVPVYAYDPAAMYEPYASGPISLLQIASRSATAAKTRGVMLEQVSGDASKGTEKGATPWAHQKAFMAALQQQMRSDGDADM